MSNRKIRHFIEGKRIYLREVRLSDVNENYYRWMNDPEVIQYLESRFFPNSREMIELYVKQMEESTDIVFMAIIVKDSDKHIGNIKIHRINWFHRYAEVSLVIGEKEFWGKGYGTEAINLAVGHAFNTLNLHKLSARMYANNVGSIKAFKKANFFKEGLLKEHCFCRGSYVDKVLLGIACSPGNDSKIQ